jgi:hypothetical protein
MRMSRRNVSLVETRAAKSLATGLLSRNLRCIRERGGFSILSIIERSVEPALQRSDRTEKWASTDGNL